MLVRFRVGLELAVSFAALGLLAGSPPARACAVTEADIDKNGSMDLRITGSAGKQNAIIEIHNTGYLVMVDCNGNGIFTNPGDIVKSGTATIETYYVDLQGGDVVTINQTEDI